ncbi:MAG: GNAT family N-acetyltransferase [Opitutales bacterium]
MKFKKATTEDIQTIRTLADVIFHATYEELISEAQMDYMFEWMYSPASLEEQLNTGHVFHIAYIDEEPCGFFSVELEDESKNLYHLQKLYLLPKFHGNGSKLLRGVFDYVKSVSPQKASIHLNVNRDNNRAIRFYEKSGLIKLRSVDVEIAPNFYMNDYIMGIDLERL